MNNETKQTAVEWQFEQLFNSFEKFNNGKYTFDEYLKRNLEIRDQAKEMEKERLIHAFDEGQEYEYQYHINSTPKFDSETWYNETYGGNNHLCCTPEGHIKRYLNCIGCDRKPLTYGGNK